MNISTHRQLAKEIKDAKVLSISDRKTHNLIRTIHSKLDDLIIRDNDNPEDNCRVMRVYYGDEVNSTYRPIETPSEKEKNLLLEKIRFISKKLETHYQDDLFVDFIRKRLLKAELGVMKWAI